ncbi:hypothetical protein AVEN_106264-1 [Araneus ventricosus]|uniref:HAT C-terminal dimerisation domain-containing protein n=1 Tax=Araneus ventricosus TaxID=182803 RepID=A0A4Y2X1A2_ARAVE|nr:hypothetical protein AVEN_106264-1 [Araneus ventricosus]
MIEGNPIHIPREEEEYELASVIKNASIQNVSEAYDLDMEKIKGEIQIFQKMYKKYIDFLPEIFTEITELRKRCNFLVAKELCDIFPYLTKLIQILLLIPVSTASSYLRNSMCQERLFALDVLKIENTIDIDFTKVHVLECLCKVGVLPVVEDDAGVEQVARALDVDAGAVHVTPVRAPQLAQAPQQDLEQERQNGQSPTPCGVVFLKH